MVKVTAEIKELFTKQAVIPMSTTDKLGNPNIIYVLMWWWKDDETLVVTDNFLNKTRKNIEENPKASFVCFSQEKGKSYQIKCTTKIETSGKLFDQGHKMAIEYKPPLPGKAVVICKVTEVYQALYGPGAGSKII
jgi:hypothetical protein